MSGFAIRDNVRRLGLNTAVVLDLDGNEEEDGGKMEEHQM